MRELPKEGEEAGARAEAIVGITGEVAAEHSFIVEEGEDDLRRCRRKAKMKRDPSTTVGMTDEGRAHWSAEVSLCRQHGKSDVESRH